MNRKMLASCAALALVLGFSSLAEAGCSPEEAQQKAGAPAEQDRADDHGNMQNGHVDKAQRNDSQRREAENERERDEQRRDDELPEIHVLHGNTSVQVPMRDTLRFLGETGNTCAGAAPRMPSVAVIIKGIAFLRLRIHVKMWYDKKK